MTTTIDVVPAPEDVKKPATQVKSHGSPAREWIGVS